MTLLDSRCGPNERSRTRQKEIQWRAHPQLTLTWEAQDNGGSDPSLA